jgi:hypothetical protein
MSVGRIDYVMVGIDVVDKVKGIDLYDDSIDNKYLAYVEERCEMTIVQDDMSCKYCFFGRVLKRAVGNNGLDITPLDIEKNINVIKQEVEDAYYQLFNEPCKFENIQLYCFTKWA